MVEVSDKWKEKFNETLVPESFVEITCGITEPGINKKATIVTSSAAPFSTFHSIALSNNASISRYSTGELNLTVLDGSCAIVSSSPPYGTTGFLSAKIFDDSNHPVIRLELPSESKSSIPGVSICWSTVFEEYATDFSVSAYLGTNRLKTVTVNGNKSVRSDVDVELSGFDAVEIEVLKWCLPNRRVRVEQVKIGRYLVFDKTKILSYSHSSARDPISGQLSQESISFSLDNSDRTWDSVNPQGIYKYIYERQPVTVRYGMDVDGKTEWVSGGMFFLSEWSVPANSIEASFQARDAFLYLSSTKYTGRKYGTLYEMCYDALEQLEADGITAEISDELKDYSTDITSDGSAYHNSDILQLAANAAGMALYQTRDGVIKINRVYGSVASDSVLDIPVLNNYSWPEITFAQNMLNVVTTVGGATYAYPESPSGKGVSQTLSNVMLTKDILAKSRNALTESYGVLSNRRKASLTYRASPIVDALDMVKIHHQFNYDAVLLVTNAKYTFNGCFKGTVELAQMNGVNTNIANGFAGVNSAICQLGYQNAQLVNGLERSVSNGDNAISLAIMQEGNARQAGQTALATQLASCCCENKQLIGDLKYTIATEDCATRQAIADNARAVIDNCNANYRAMMDYFTQDKIATLTAENQSLKFAASQDRQNALLTSAMSAQTDTILNRVNPRPIPAYQVANPNLGVNCCGCC
jgi:hypothetical protein|nr:MAG TPA: hypothetical protein [Caudoviricetes sp.]